MSKQKDVQAPAFIERTHPPILKLPIQKRQPDVNQKLRALPIDQKFKELLGPDRESLMRLQKRQQKEKRAIEALIKQGKIQIVKPDKKPEKVAPDQVQYTEEGKLIVKGSIVQFQQPTSLKINQAIKQKEKIEEISKKQKQYLEAFNDKNKYYFDRHLSSSQNSFRKRQKKNIMSFNFIEKGVNVKQEDIKMEEESEKPEQKIHPIIFTGFKRQQIKMKHHDPIPMIEWWDVALFPAVQSSYVPIEGDLSEKQTTTAHTVEQIEQNLNQLVNLEYKDEHILIDRISKLVEHPKPFVISEIIQQREKATLPSYLTKKERKKRLRKLRMDAEKEKQDKIRLGLRQPSPPKIRLQNMMKIMCTEAILDPSKAEKEVKKQIQARLDKHKEHNENRQLTKEERGIKLKQKWQKDAQSEIKTAVFRIESLADNQQQFKVNMNAKQLQLSGVCLQSTGYPSIVVCEGGPKGIKFYKKLILNRIKWTDGPARLIWEGTSKQHAFNKWKHIEVKSEAEGRRVLAEKGVEQFWDLAMSQQ